MAGPDSQRGHGLVCPLPPCGRGRQQASTSTYANKRRVASEQSAPEAQRMQEMYMRKRVLDRKIHWMKMQEPGMLTLAPRGQAVRRGCALHMVGGTSLGLRHTASSKHPMSFTACRKTTTNSTATVRNHRRGAPEPAEAGGDPGSWNASYYSPNNTTNNKNTNNASWNATDVCVPGFPPCSVHPGHLQDNGRQARSA